jgi:hypothetical protein
MNHKAIYALYPNVVTIDDEAGAFDANGDKVIIDTALVSSWVNPEYYKDLRSMEYPSFAEQFDLLYHGGLEAWKESIKSVKDKYPKE